MKHTAMMFGGKAIEAEDGILCVAMYCWDVGTAAWVRYTPAGGSSGGLTDAELRADPVPVSVTFPGTQAVSGSVAVSNFPASQAVTGTFWQSTQPVSLASVPSHAVTGPLTNTELRASPVPVSIGSSSAFTFVSTKTAAPTANAVQADTGALAAGDYEFKIVLAASDTVAVGKGLVVEHRNAANSANINVLGGCSAAESREISIAKLTLAANERIRVIAGTAAGAASSMYISAIGRRAA